MANPSLVLDWPVSPNPERAVSLEVSREELVEPLEELVESDSECVEVAAPEDTRDSTNDSSDSEDVSDVKVISASVMDTVLKMYCVDVVTCGNESTVWVTKTTTVRVSARGRSMANKRSRLSDNGTLQRRLETAHNK